MHVPWHGIQLLPHSVGHMSTYIAVQQSDASMTSCWHLFLIFIHSFCSICRKQSSVTAMLHDLKSRCKGHSMSQNTINITLLMDAVIQFLWSEWNRGLHSRFPQATNDDTMFNHLPHAAAKINHLGMPLLQMFQPHYTWGHAALRISTG